MASVSPYNELEQAEALTCLALANGGRQRCEELLKGRSLNMAYATVVCWRDRKPDLYAKCRNKVEEHINTHLADAHFEMAAEAIALERRLITDFNQMLDSGTLDAKEKSQIYRSASISGGIHTQRGLELTSKPQDITVKHDFSDIKQIIAKATEGRVSIKAGRANVIDAPAVEEPA